MSNNINPSLGDLERLPTEIRNTIYELAIDSSAEQINLLGRCTPYTNLAFVSKQVTKEVIGIITPQYKSARPAHSTFYFLEPKCQHNAFIWALPKQGLKKMIDEWKKDSDSASVSVTCHKLDSFPFTIKYITGHLHEHAPNSVTFKIDLPNARTYLAPGSQPMVQRDGCKLISLEGGHPYVQRHTLDLVNRRINALQHWAIGKKTFDPRVVTNCLFDIAVILQRDSVKAGLLISKMQEKIRDSHQKREAKRDKTAATQGSH